MKYLIIVILISIMILGCVEMPSPDSLIEPPKSHSMTTSKYDFFTELIDDDKIVLDSNQILGYEVLNWGENGYIGFYSDGKLASIKGFAVVKHNSNNTEMIINKSFSKNSNYKINSYRYLDLIGGSEKELLVEYSAYDDPKLIEIYGFENAEPKLLYELEGNHYEIIYNVDGKPSLSIWIKNARETYYVEIFKWLESSFVQDTYEHHDYYLKTLDGYRDRAFGATPSSIYIYYYGDHLMKSGEYQEAIEVLTGYLEVNNIKPIYIMKSYFVIGKSLYELGRYDEAVDALEIAVNEPVYYIDKLIEAKLLLADAYRMLGEDTLEKEALVGIEALIQQYNKDDFKHQMWMNELP